MKIIVQSVDWPMRRDFSSGYCGFIESLQEREIVVDTSRLCSDRFYVEEKRYNIDRVFKTHVLRIINDERIGMSHCNGCDKSFVTGSSHKCHLFKALGSYEYLPGTRKHCGIDYLVDKALEEIYQIEESK